MVPSISAQAKPVEHNSFWLWVMCLTGVDYFSTLGYQPSIAFEAVGILAPIATVVLVFVTLFCAYPVYSYVAGESPHGQGSISMLEKLMGGWHGKILVLILLGFAATDFVITKTLSAADAAEHLIHNPFWQQLSGPSVLHSQLVITMFLLVMLGAMFLRGFREVIAIAVGIVAVYLLLNLIVVGSGLFYVLNHPAKLVAWKEAVWSGNWQFHGSEEFAPGILSAIFVSLLFFPKLALGLSGFETGIAVMPLVLGAKDDDPQRPRVRIANTRKLLLLSAVIMSTFLLGSSIVTSMLIEPKELLEGGHAKDRALAFIAHGETVDRVSPIFGEVFGTLYDISTIAILWFAGASAMSGLLNLVPRYLPRYGMAPRWAEAVRPLVVVLTVINLVVTWIFQASVSAQGGAYATGVMVLMVSTCIAVVIDVWSKRRGLQWHQRMAWSYVLIAAAFLYTTARIIWEKPEGLKIASAFIAAVMVFSIISRTRRSMELRFTKFEFVDDASHVLWDTLRHLEFPVLVPHRPGHQTIAEKEERIRSIHRLTPEIPIVFVEAILGDTSNFHQTPLLEVLHEQGRFVLKVTRCVSIAHALAAIALELSRTGRPPELHFGWSDESTFWANLNFVLFGEGNVPWLVRELIHNAEPDPAKRPNVIIG
jgi:hypothetical protein